MRCYCASGGVIEHVEHLLAEHISEVVTGASGALAFFQQRFSGRAAKNTCAAIPPP